MKIIDKNNDFYDFYQNIYKDDTFTFDRRDSFILTKELMCNSLTIPHIPSYFLRGNPSFKIEYPYGYNFLLFQVCYTYWLFLIKITEINEYNRVQNYEIQFLANWENINKPKKFYSLEIIEFYYFFYEGKKQIADYIKDIDTNNYKVRKKINSFTIYNGNKKEEKHIPLLKACGIADHIDALKLYLALEEYFSLEKTSSERRDPLNTTDIDKIESHGFDKKTSFRGKQKRKRKKT